MNREKIQDYVFYLVDMVSAVIAIIFSVTDAYAGGTDQMIVKVPLMGLSLLFKYVYLVYYAVAKFAL
jgi:hypothetical protein